MATFRSAKAVTKNTRTFFVYPARNAELHEQQRQLQLPVHELLESGKTRFLTFGDSAVRQFEQLPAIIAALESWIEKHKTEHKVC
jgi:hypothetical protein